MIPESIDPLKLIAELNAAGWRDYKIEIACALPVGYISNVKSRKVKNPRYRHAAALMNFHAENVSHGTVNNQTEVFDVVAQSCYASRRSGPCSP